ncbi:unnamed protein product [Amoebophrya sp. A120]|nr:unnamed protein product [Amoebophrya sp. A120]|eukprot:GSA120T00002720001.1
MQEVVVVVDPYSSGKYLVQELKDQSWPMVAIQSSMELAPFWLQQLESQYFVECIVHESLEKTLEQLAKYKVKAVTPGSEPGVFLSEDLQEGLGLTEVNGSETKMWRRHKFNMQERLREVGVRAIRQIYAKDAEEALEWQVDKNKGLWPIIVKPAMSGGTDGVYWCHCPEDVKAAFEAECGKVNVNGELNDCLLAQEFLDGTEYIVDCVSHDSKHVLCGIWQYKKVHDTKTKSISYHHGRMIASTGEVQDQLVEYMFQCLDALDIKYGASHGEVIMTVDGPCLVEVGARMQGLKGPMLTGMATGVSVQELVADVLVNGARLHSVLHSQNFRYVQKKFCAQCMFHNPRTEGTLSRPIDAEGWVRDLRSCIGVFPTIKVGEQLVPTRDLASSPGAFLLIHANEQVVTDDEAAVRKMESEDLFVVNAPETPVDQMIPSPGRKLSHHVSPYVVSPRQEFCRDTADDAFDANLHELELNFEDAADPLNDTKVEARISRHSNVSGRDSRGPSVVSGRVSGGLLASPEKQAKISVTSNSFADSPALVGA